MLHEQMVLGNFWKKFLGYPVKFSYFVEGDSVAEDVIWYEVLLMDRFVNEYKNYTVKDFEVSNAVDGFNLYVRIGK